MDLKHAAVLLLKYLESAVNNCVLKAASEVGRVAASSVIMHSKTAEPPAVIACDETAELMRTKPVIRPKILRRKALRPTEDEEPASSTLQENLKQDHRQVKAMQTVHNKGLIRPANEEHFETTPCKQQADAALIVPDICTASGRQQLLSILIPALTLLYTINDDELIQGTIHFFRHTLMCIICPLVGNIMHGAAAPTLTSASSATAEVPSSTVSGVKEVSVMRPPLLLTDSTAFSSVKHRPSHPDAAHYLIQGLITSLVAAYSMSQETNEKHPSPHRQQNHALGNMCTTENSTHTFDFEEPLNDCKVQHVCKAADIETTSDAPLQADLDCDLLCDLNFMMSADHNSLFMASIVNVQLSGLNVVHYSVLAVLLPLAASFQTTTGVHPLSLSTSAQEALSHICSDLALKLTMAAENKLLQLPRSTHDNYPDNYRSMVRQMKMDWIAPMLISVCTLTAQIHLAATVTQKCHPSEQKQADGLLPKQADLNQSELSEFITALSQPGDCMRAAAEHLLQSSKEVKNASSKDDAEEELRRRQHQAEEAEELCACLQLLTGHQLQAFHQGFSQAGVQVARCRTMNCSKNKCSNCMAGSFITAQVQDDSRDNNNNGCPLLVAGGGKSSTAGKSSSTTAEIDHAIVTTSTARRSKEDPVAPMLSSSSHAEPCALLFIAGVTAIQGSSSTTCNVVKTPGLLQTAVSIAFRSIMIRSLSVDSKDGLSHQGTCSNLNSKAYLMQKLAARPDIKQLGEATDFLISGQMERLAHQDSIQVTNSQLVERLAHQDSIQVTNNQLEIPSLVTNKQRQKNQDTIRTVISAAATGDSRQANLNSNNVNTAVVVITPGSVACRLARVLGQYKGSLQVILDLLHSADEDAKADDLAVSSSGKTYPSIPNVIVPAPIKAFQDKENTSLLCRNGRAPVLLDNDELLPEQDPQLELLQVEPEQPVLPDEQDPQIVGQQMTSGSTQQMSSKSKPRLVNNKALVGKHTDLVLLLVKAMYDGNVPALVSTLCALLTPESNCHLETRLKVLSVLREEVENAVSSLDDTRHADRLHAAMWPSEALKQLSFAVMHDPAVRFRRAAVSLLSLVAVPQSSPEAKSLCHVLLAKMRDKDSVVSRRSMELVLQLPMDVMHCCCTLQEWTFILSHGISRMAGVPPPLTDGRMKSSQQGHLGSINESHNHDVREGDIPHLALRPDINSNDVEGEKHLSNKTSNKLSRGQQRSGTKHKRVKQRSITAVGAVTCDGGVQEADPEFMQQFTTFFSNFVHSYDQRAKALRHEASGTPLLNPVQLLSYVDLDEEIIRKALTKILVHRVNK
ncbi:hypothetical protein CEUSTIGMA_g6480.t1 [Chlamydomonas eustigma]|uniref:Uncharacterized protein n=1 Tax=Chlamydomonas eustigma TaxID=1157962 RepID=A0A250X8E5_9CHLO|nr:hypothetical protein CEUSTIGMA_g6480.t1 [Chlamydomonas eustigma]|eukprot:GAX79040.1 hypothetical protein CEUSTIGMA_g6480.t1 [Chlamydomonas eustigma]